MRYTPDGNTASLTLESPAQPSPINLYPSSAQPPSIFNTTPAAYQTDGGGGAYFPSTSQLFSSLDVRPRLGSTTYVAPPSTLPSLGQHFMSTHTAGSSNPSTGMAHAPRSTTLPIPPSQITTRDIYAPATPTFRRNPDHPTRSPPFVSALRRHPLSPEPSPSLGFTTPLRMDSSFGPKSQQNIPPLHQTTHLGSLSLADGSTNGSPVKVEINGTIDKGFFLADNEWTCYRRNYFSCVCSYSMTPYFPTTPLHFHQSNSSSNQPFTVYGFAMCISAVVADNDGHAIELVQHTPKRDKGPIVRPERVRLNPKPSQPSAHALGLYGSGDSGMGGATRYDQSYPQQQGQYPTEHTFERIQFKQATANNGKRRAAQQYYHLLVELWADVGAAAPEQFVKVAYRKSAKMIVRGRSPGHYQSERRGSSSGPGGSSGSLGNFPSHIMGHDYSSSNTGMMSGYNNTYDTRQVGHYNSGPRHHHDLPMDQVMSAEDVKAITETKDYQYYPAPIYEGNTDPHRPVEMFSHQHQQHRGEDSVLPALGSGADLTSKVKSDYDASGGRSNVFYPGSAYYQQRCGRFEGKSSSSGYYPTAMMPPPTGMNIT